MSTTSCRVARVTTRGHGTAEQVFGDPQRERTRRFLRGIVKAGRL